MLDVSALIQSYMDSQWMETNPAKADLKYSFDEFDPNAMTPQIVFENKPAKETFITKFVTRIDHECKITIYVRPVNYIATTIASTKVTFRAMKTEIDRILRLGRFEISTINVVEPNQWADEPLEVGFDQREKPKEPIVFKAELIVKCTYYAGVCT